jgi:hypothetical protein
MVYNGTSWGLNGVLFAPNFWLPTPSSAARVLGFAYLMLLNFPLPVVLKRYPGVDFEPYRKELKLHFADQKGKAWPHWTRWWMGLTPSPYMAMTFYYFADEFARGNRLDPNNSLKWDSIILDLSGDPLFDPTLLWVMKWDLAAKKIAGDILAFVDNLHALGQSVEQAWGRPRIRLGRGCSTWVYKMPEPGLGVCSIPQRRW